MPAEPPKGKCTNCRQQSIMARLILLIACLALALQAQDDLSRLKELVEAGALPRQRLQEAEAKQEEAKDQEILKATLYGKLGLEDMTTEKSQSMVAAAQRLWDRQKDRLKDAEKLVNEGAKSPTSVVPFLEEFDRMRRVFDAAERRASLFKELAEMARAEQEREARTSEESLADPSPADDRYAGEGIFLNAHLASVEYAFKREFGKPLPVSAAGETELHRAMGYDHRGRVDVALYPDSKEGAWLRKYLEFLKVPYLAFRGQVQGQATAAHIHIGPPSARIRKAD